MLNVTQQKLNQKLSTFTNNYTAKLWIQYLHLNNLLGQHLRAERFGNWRLYLDALCRILLYLAACGHNNYTKSLWLYLQQMNNLEHNIPQTYQDLMAGYHVARRTEHHNWEMYHLITSLRKH